MDRQARVLVPIFVFITIIAFACFGVAFHFYQKEKEKVASLQEALTDAQTRYKLTEKKLEEAKRQAVQLETQLQEAKNQIEILNNQLNNEKKSKEETIQQLQQLKTLIEQKESLEVELKEKLNSAQKDIRRLEAKVKNLESEREELEKKLKSIEEEAKKIELGQIVVEQKGPVQEKKTKKVVSVSKEETTKLAPAEKTLEGKILVVNKDYNFVVINLGSQQGVSLGDVFSVYHKEKYIGDIKVEKVHDSMSAAGLLSPEMKDKVFEGDRVSLKLE